MTLNFAFIARTYSLMILLNRRISCRVEFGRRPPLISLYDLSSKLAKNLHFNALWGLCPTLSLRYNWEFIITNPSSHYLSILFSLHCNRDHPETLPISSFSQVKCECIESWHWFQFWIFPLLEITSQFGKYTTIKASLASNPSHAQWPKWPHFDA